MPKRHFLFYIHFRTGKSFSKKSYAVSKEVAPCAVSRSEFNVFFKTQKKHSAIY